MMERQEPLRIELRPTETEISPLLFGHFIEFIENCIQGGVYDPGSPSSDENGVRQDVLEKARGLRPAILRWPGGTYANIYHWMDSVGPRSQRKRKKNIIWGGVNDGMFGTAEFIGYCRRLGAEPMICVNMASGTPEEAANWVEYCNGEPGSYYADLRVAHGYPEPFCVKYWCIGNESAAVPDLGPQHDPKRYITDAWEFTKHMKLTDPSIKLVFVGEIGNDAWNKQILESLGPVCDYFSIHHYSGGAGEYSCFDTLRDFQGMLDALISLVNGFSMRKEPFSRWYRFPPREGGIKLCIDEWNIWNGTPMGEDNRFGVKVVFTWRDALWVSCMLNMLVRYADSIGIANLAQMVNVLAPILTEGGRSYVQTVYHVLKLYRDFLWGRRVDCRMEIPVQDVDGADRLPMLDHAAGLRDGGEVCLFLTNISKEAIEVRLPEDYRLKKWVCLTADSFDAFNTLDREAVRRVEKNAADVLCLEAGTVNMLLLS